MPSVENLKEAERVMTICNACRYCEGFCAVFPAMELRRSFTEADLTYLANLCHNCRGCYYACQYAPPHEFQVNVPKALAEVRTDSYRDFAWPRRLGALFGRNALAAGLITSLSVAMVLLVTLWLVEPSVWFAVHRGEGAFYEVIPWGYMVAPASAISLWMVVAFVVGFFRFWQSVGGRAGELLDLRSLLRGGWDALTLRYLKGGGEGCNYPDQRFSHARAWLHHFVFYGFVLSFASTTVAAAYDHVLHWQAPYPLWSLPVVLGTLGGIGLSVGTGGLLWIRTRASREPSTDQVRGMDAGLLWLLFLTAVTGLMLLALRETVWMGLLLALHLGVVLGLFLILPYGKFVHAIYRSAALVRHAMEQDRP